MPSIIDPFTGITTGEVNVVAGALQHLDISASVASNAITVTLRRCTLSFRKASLINGTPDVVNSGGDLTLTIEATDSFGAVTTDGIRRIAILAVNNAGSMRLAASSLAGGVNLDETGVITTAATATTNTAIKATAVNTGVAYRIVGFIDVPFTTAVGWGALVTVQPIGGQALSAMSSLGYGQTWQSLIGSRAVGTTYYNTTGRPIVVSLTGGSAVNNTWIFNVNGAVVGFSSSPGQAGYSQGGNFIVPVAASYSVTLSGSDPPSGWYELR